MLNFEILGFFFLGGGGGGGGDRYAIIVDTGYLVNATPPTVLAGSC